MSASRTPGYSRLNLNKNHKFSIAGVAALGAAALTFSLVPGNASAEADTKSVAATAPVAWSAAAGSVQAKTVHTSITQQQVGADKVAKAVAEARAKADAKAEAAAKAKAAADAKAKAEAKKRADERAAASRAAARKPVYANNLDGWIREAMSIMKKHNIPGSYEGIHRNIIRESAGDPRAINNWDINAINGIPSKGLLQVIKPTFDAYHVPGTKHDQYDPVANIVAACNYAADRYGSMDNVNSAY
ncbi:transglycosylase SLT domain-containing protein [Streptomyces flavidovirens]|uniref:Transglycosylase SLT domain-containing protein n=1 Tax=Streptomyces flavidovirens TaxID=67298 RepID=A0ABW6R6J2_9ACTN|nr:transglycosylase SLT domain-containing protein [Streptomyces sp. ISL-99]MBT2528946.1 transglycosylase SLT domain-containing protein [Streptomyces sp. ISL-99]